MNISNITPNVPLSQSSPLINSHSNSIKDNITTVHNTAGISLSSLEFDKIAPLNFNHYFFNQYQQAHSPTFRSLIAKYRAYPHKTLGEYREAKQYPTGKDIRPQFFDPEGSNIAAHGTNFETLLRASINCNLQIVPGLKVFKLQGGQSETGESAYTGTTHLNCEVVSTVDLRTLTSDFREVKRYAHHAASDFLQGDENVFNTTPVIIIGDGINKSRVSSGISNEVGFKRLNIRIIAFKNEESRKTGIEWLRKVRDEFGVSDITSLKTCTFKELNSIVSYYGIDNPKSSPPLISSLWEKSESLS